MNHITLRIRRLDSGRWAYLDASEEHEGEVGGPETWADIVSYLEREFSLRDSVRCERDTLLDARVRVARAAGLRIPRGLGLLAKQMPEGLAERISERFHNGGSLRTASVLRAR